MIRGWVLPLPLILSACGGDDDGGDGPDGGSNGLPGSCFYSCPVAIGTLYGCRSTTGEDEQDCATTAEEECDPDPVTDSEFLADCTGCDPECAPDWYMP